MTFPARTKVVFCLAFTVLILALAEFPAFSSSRTVGRSTRIVQSDSGEVELLWRRTATERVFRRTDGTLRKEVSLAPIHYQDEDGSFKPINTTIRPAASGGFTNEANSMVSRFPEKSASPVTLTRRLGGERLSWKPGGLFIRHANGKKTLLARPEAEPALLTGDGAVLYENIYPAISEKYRVIAGILKHEVILNERPDIQRYRDGDRLSIDWVMEPENISFIEKDGEDLILFDINHEPCLSMPAPHVVDQKAESVSRSRTSRPRSVEKHSLVLSHAVRNSNGNMSISLEIPLDEILDDSVAFPLVIDPTTVDLALDEQDVTVYGDDDRDRITLANSNFTHFMFWNWHTSFISGDLNNDGIDDLILFSCFGDGPFNTRNQAGEVYVQFGPFIPGTIIDLASGADVTIYGEQSGDYLASSMTAGDVSGDGLEDLIVGSFLYDQSVSLQGVPGKVYVFFSPLSAGTSVDLRTAPADVVIHGAGTFDNLGGAVAVGDLNGDGLGDLVIGAPHAEGPADQRLQAGEVYVLFGPMLSGTTIDLGTASADVTVYGAEKADCLGAGIAVSDLNGDFFDDLIVSAVNADGPGPGRDQAGVVHILFGPFQTNMVVDLQTQVADVIIFGELHGSVLGDLIATGDITGDGSTDLVLRGRVNPAIQSSIYGIFGPFSFSPQTIDLSLSQPDVLIFDPDLNIGLGEGMTVEDVTGDGIDDIIVGATWAGDRNSRRRGGEVYVLHGPFATGTAIDIKAASPDMTVFGAERGDELGNAVAVGDVTGDGVGDLIMGAHSASGPSNTRTACGEVYVVFSEPANPPPVADAGGPYAIECNGQPSTLMLDGTNSSDPNNDPIDFSWTTDCPNGSFDDDTSSTPTLSLDGPPPCPVVCTVTLMITDFLGATDTDTAQVTVDDTTPPTVQEGQDDLFCLWPPNHWYVCFDSSDLTPVITDDCSQQPTWQITGCKSDQPDNARGMGDGNTVDDCVILPNNEGFCVRSERAGTEPAGRHYTVTITAADECGNTSGDAAIGMIYAPHDQSPKRTCIDATKFGCKKLPCNKKSRRR
ncbi:hypothetical protein ACFLU6_12095 [Acidobacteriota bacterium]